MPRARHHTDVQGLREIQRTGVINPGRGDWIGVHVEVEPFGSTAPGRVGPKEQTGAHAGGAYVEFDLPATAIPYKIGPRNTAVIPTHEPMSLDGLNPIYVRVKRWWQFWYFWQ